MGLQTYKRCHTHAGDSLPTCSCRFKTHEDSALGAFFGGARRAAWIRGLALVEVTAGVLCVPSCASTRGVHSNVVTATSIVERVSYIPGPHDQMLSSPLECFFAPRLKPPQLAKRMQGPAVVWLECFTCCIPFFGGKGAAQHVCLLTVHSDHLGHDGSYSVLLSGETA
eukprot:563447-Amphidinium_carterae.1